MSLACRDARKIINYLFIYLVGDLTGVAASKWHMTPKRSQAKSTNMQTDAVDASKSKEKQQQWINKNQINIKIKLEIKKKHIGDTRWKSLGGWWELVGGEAFTFARGVGWAEPEKAFRVEGSLSAYEGFLVTIGVIPIGNRNKFRYGRKSPRVF